MSTILNNYHEDALRSFRSYKAMGERAIEQISDEEFFALIDPEANSIALIVKHIAGNLHSRWRDFLTTDGEKPDRDRDSEFELREDSRDSLMRFWHSGWQILFENIEPLTHDDLSRTVTIRSQPHTVVEAINRQMMHYAYHIGQIVLLAKHFRSTEWQTLSIPKKRSADFNRHMDGDEDAKSGRKDRFEAAADFNSREVKGEDLRES